MALGQEVDMDWGRYVKPHRLASILVTLIMKGENVASRLETQGIKALPSTGCNL